MFILINYCILEILSERNSAVTYATRKSGVVSLYFSNCSESINTDIYCLLLFYLYSIAVIYGE
ncbi:hypothetical protein T4B_1892 [Trichinella pseudospiralis]|uniref:Uncharacterized protein n=1 Tax=Trichinella pseudospiralis TaxID=6337 RepID=A0A0V1GA42_TRIPS|nr:hypothetical protein T4B_1892 [Trichinella pseudospiralis]